MIDWLFDWTRVSMMEATPGQEIKGMVCIMVSLALIGLIGWLIDEYEEGLKKMIIRVNDLIVFLCCAGIAVLIGLIGLIIWEVVKK